jgi:hypothetical protein
VDVFGTLEGRQDYTIHGELYAQLYFSLPEDPENIQQCRLPSDAFDADLKPGDKVRITMLLRTVMEMRRADAP